MVFKAFVKFSIWRKKNLEHHPGRFYIEKGIDFTMPPQHVYAKGKWLLISCL